MINRKGQRKYKEIAGERFPIECVQHIMVDDNQIEGYRKCERAANMQTELEIKEQRIHDPDTPIKTFMLLETEDKKNGWFSVSFWIGL